MGLFDKAIGKEIADKLNRGEDPTNMSSTPKSPSVGNLLPPGWRVDITYSTGYWQDGKRIPEKPKVRIENYDREHGGQLATLSINAGEWESVKAAVDKVMQFVADLPIKGP
jgi:hypothetical protein